MNLSDLTVKQLRQVIKYYSLHTRIIGYNKMKKAELLKKLSRHVYFEDGQLILASNYINFLDAVKDKIKIKKKVRSKVTFGNLMNRVKDSES